MGKYLTFQGNRKYDSKSQYPDENYAREIMQLFTIGLWKLNPDGTKVLDADGNLVPMYDNNNIMDFSRIFTGLDARPNRANYEQMKGGKNRIDPMGMTGTYHDPYPKPDLDGNFQI